MKRKLKVLGGRTGSGKTEILEELGRMGEAVIDLEGLACHKGSAFGSIGMSDQPSTEHFENLLFEELYRHGSEREIWVEDESRNIGRIFLPEAFYSCLWDSPLYIIKVPREQRVERLCRDYTAAGQDPLIASLEKIRKRLGGDRTNQAVTALREGRIEEAASIALDYYDKCYDYSTTGSDRNIAAFLELASDNPAETAGKLISS